MIVRILIPLFLTFSIFGQDVVRSGFLPGVNISVPLTNVWKMNFRAESTLFVNDFNTIENESTYASFRNIEFSTFATRKVLSQHAAALGYGIRIDQEGNLRHRIAQQFTFIDHLKRFRTAHRLRSDQLLQEDRFAFLFRYRYGIEIPFNGEKVDPGEMYLLSSSELLWTFTSEKQNAGEIRLNSVIGFQLNERSKLETGFDFRLDGLNSDLNRLSIWLSLNYFFAF